MNSWPRRQCGRLFSDRFFSVRAYCLMDSEYVKNRDILSFRRKAESSIHAHLWIQAFAHGRQLARYCRWHQGLTEPIASFPHVFGGNPDPRYDGIAVWLDSRQKHAGMTV